MFDKNKKFYVVIVAQTFQRLPVHMPKDANATHQCTVNDAIVNVILRFQFTGVIKP